MNLRGGVTALRSNLDQSRRELCLFVGDDVLVNHVAQSFVMPLEQRKDRLIVEPFQRWYLPCPTRGGKYAVDSPLIAAGPQVEPLLFILRYPLRVLNRFAVHIGDPQRAIGPGAE